VLLARQYSAIGAELGPSRRASWPGIALLRGEPAAGGDPVAAIRPESIATAWLPRSATGSVRVGTQSRRLDRLVPKQHTTGGKDRLGGITKQGNRYFARAASSPAQWPSSAMRQNMASQAAMAGTIDGAPADQGGRGRTRQQGLRGGLAIMVHGDRYKEPELQAAA